MITWQWTPYQIRNCYFTVILISQVWHILIQTTIPQVLRKTWPGRGKQPGSGFLEFLSTLSAHGHLQGTATCICLCGPVRQHQLSRPVCDSVQEPRWCLILWVLKRHLQRPQRSPSLRWQNKRSLGLDGEYFLAQRILGLHPHQLVVGVHLKTEWPQRGRWRWHLCSHWGTGRLCQ